VKNLEFHFQQISLNNTDELTKLHKLRILRLKYKKKISQTNYALAICIDLHLNICRAFAEVFLAFIRLNFRTFIDSSQPKYRKESTTIFFRIQLSQFLPLTFLSMFCAHLFSFEFARFFHEMRRLGFTFLLISFHFPFTIE
jgi:hypothetical protein